MKEIVMSSTDGLSVRTSGPWIERKHYYLKRYCDIFSKAMRKKWDITYIDLFAGPGRCLITEPSQERDGSPLIALKFPFNNYVFIESNPIDFEALKKRCENSPKFEQIQFIQGNCNDVINESTTSNLNLAFIDPTDIGIHFKTIESLARNRKVDLLMNIQFGMDIKRNFKLYSKTEGSNLELFLGESVSQGQFGGARDILERYKEKIRALGYQTVKYRDIQVHNLKNVPMYFLFFASKNAKGLEFWGKISNLDEAGQGELF